RALPAEIVLDILAFLDQHDCAQAALASRAFHELALRVLYRRIVIKGRRSTCWPLRDLFFLLATGSYPARLVHTLHIDFFARPGCLVHLTPDMPPLLSAAFASMSNLTVLCLGECCDPLLVPAVQNACFPALERLALHSYARMAGFVARHAANLTHFLCIMPLPVHTPHFARLMYYEGCLHNVAVACRAASPLREITARHFNGQPDIPQYMPCDVAFALLARNAPGLVRLRLYHFGSADTLRAHMDKVVVPVRSVRVLEVQFASPSLVVTELVAAMPSVLRAFPCVTELRLSPLFQVHPPAMCPVPFCRTLSGAAPDLALLVWADKAMRRARCGAWRPADRPVEPGAWTPLIAS
ncbi:hypothetical protein AURDEDRAFT_117957, partial [Auricularia subglabra TFB-10046 SS5]